jgi:hypothetical protein
MNAALMAAMLIGMIYFFPPRAEMEKSIATMYPTGAVAYMRAHPVPSPMFNSYGFGGYLEWSSGGRDKVFIDGRGELYEMSGVFADYMHITLLQPGVLSVLHGYRVQSCLFDRDQPLAVFLAALPEWKTVYTDDISVVLVRSSANGGPVPAAEVGNSQPNLTVRLQ